jgi:hypothetical protein
MENRLIQYVENNVVNEETNYNYEEEVPILNYKKSKISTNKINNDFPDLPDEVLLEFAHRLPVRNLFLFERVNKRFNAIAKTAYRKVNLF